MQNCEVQDVYFQLERKFNEFSLNLSVFLSTVRLIIIINSVRPFFPRKTKPKKTQACECLLPKVATEPPSWEEIKMDFLRNVAGRDVVEWFDTNRFQQVKKHQPGLK